MKKYTLVSLFTLALFSSVGHAEISNPFMLTGDAYQSCFNSREMLDMKACGFLTLVTPTTAPFTILAALAQANDAILAAQPDAAAFVANDGANEASLVLENGINAYLSVFPEYKSKSPVEVAEAIMDFSTQDLLQTIQKTENRK